ATRSRSVFPSTISCAMRFRLRWIASPSSRTFSEETPAWLNGSASRMCRRRRACASDSFPASLDRVKGVRVAQDCSGKSGRSPFFGRSGRKNATAAVQAAEPTRVVCLWKDRPMALRRFAPKDLLRETLVTHLAVAPDGSSAVYGRRTIEGNEYRTRLWRVSLGRGRAEQITTGNVDLRPRFSPDGRSLLFLSTRSGKSQPWVLPLAGGDPTQLAELEGQVGAAEWSPDGRHVLLLAESGVERFRLGDPESPMARQITGLNWRLDGLGVREQFTSLWVVPVRGGGLKRLTQPTFEVGQAFWSPDSKRIGFLADQRPEAAVLEELQALTVSLRGGRPAKLASLRGEIAAAAWSPGGKLAFLGVDERGPIGSSSIGLWVKDGRTQRELGAELDRTIYYGVVRALADLSSRLPPPVIWA